MGMSAVEPAAPAVAPLVRVSFVPDVPGQVGQHSDGLEARSGDWYVVATPDGERLGRVARYELPVVRPAAGRPVGTLLRAATPEEIEKSRHLAEVEREALRVCRERARELHLPVRPVSAFVPLDRDLVVMTYATEERVELKELVRAVSRQLRRRIELRQVGVRDQAKLSGGWGPCGRMLCCSSHMNRFTSISIRMAKAQNLSLNPTRISGMCGRLMCCLAHEAGDAPPRGRAQSRH
jgi:cell fate regulator YaaT (PSP1 superfamily)